jgi:hypothetical protein
MSDFTSKDRPARVGELSVDRAALAIFAARGIRRSRGAGRDGVSSWGSFCEPAGETSGEKKGDESPLSGVSCIGDIGRLLICGGGVTEDSRGDDWLEGTGEREGEEGPGVLCSERVVET